MQSFKGKPHNKIMICLDKIFFINENPWKRKIDLLDSDSGDESSNESTQGLYQTDIDAQVSKRRRIRGVSIRIIETMNRMKAQNSRIINNFSNPKRWIN